MGFKPENILVYPSSKTGQSRQVELNGTDLWIFARTDKVFVYPDSLDVTRFTKALSDTLALWPLITGRFLLTDDHRYVIEMSDNPIPVTLVENDQMSLWPIDRNIVTELCQNELGPFLDGVDIAKINSYAPDAALVRFKMTRLKKTNELVLGISWSHILGDAASLLNFLSTISSMYQSESHSELVPIFERRIWLDEEFDSNFLPTMKILTNAKPALEMFSTFTASEQTYDQVNICFSGDQLKFLNQKMNDSNLTIQDTLSAYLIRTLNVKCYQDNKGRWIQRVKNVVNIRGVSDEIARDGQVSNAICSMLSDDFEDPTSVKNIAQTIRRSIRRCRDKSFLQSWMATADRLMRKMAQENKLADWNPVPNEVTINSNYRFDWQAHVDFGFKDRTRFYTVWAGPFYFRIFRLNPCRHDMDWLPRDHHGVEVAFQIEKENKERFVRACQSDFEENFFNVQ